MFDPLSEGALVRPADRRPPITQRRTTMRDHLHWLCLTMWIVASPATSQSFPERPLRIIVGFTSGTAADIVARQIAVKLAESFGKQVIVENREGAGGTIGTGI